jgi:hypothetical protein
MNRKELFTLIAAGMLGGALSDAALRICFSRPAYAAEVGQNVTVVPPNAIHPGTFPNEVVAQNFVVVDAVGARRARLGWQADGSLLLSFTNSGGQTAVQIGLGPAGNPIR